MQPSLPLSRYPGLAPLFRDYAGNYPRVAAWFHYPPDLDQGVEQRLAELDSQAYVAVLRQIERGPWAAAVHAQQQRYGAGPLALEAAGRLGRPETYIVVTGQQAGLWGGPLYTQLKALTVVKLARELKRLHPDRHFVPMFWIASGDSDFDEMRTTQLIDAQGELAQLGLPPAPSTDDLLIIGARAAGTALDQALEQLTAALPHGLHREEVLAAVRACYDPNEMGGSGGLVEGFARWMARLFHDTELVIVDPQDPVLKQAARPLLRLELTRAAEGAAALTARHAELQAAGYPLQVVPHPEDTNLFLLDGAGRREKIARVGEDFVLRPSGRQISRAELLTLAEVTPERFVTGVLIRPVYENMIFPVAAWVGGAAEIAYRAQSTALFDLHGQKMAPAFYRSSATLLPPKSAEALTARGWDLDQLYALPQDVAAAAVGDERPPELDAALMDYRAVIAGAGTRLRDLAAGIDPTLERSFTTLEDYLATHVDKLEKKIVAALKRQHAQELNRLEQAQRWAFPAQVPQERRLNLLSFLPRYGWALLPWLLERLSVPSAEHQVVVLD